MRACSCVSESVCVCLSACLPARALATRTHLYVFVCLSWLGCGDASAPTLPCFVPVVKTYCNSSLQYTVMADPFAAYGSDSDGDSDAEAEEAPMPTVFKPAWQQADDESEEEEEDDTGVSGKGKGVEKRPAELTVASEEVEPKKRKLLDPFAAMSQASTSFLAAAVHKEEPEFFRANAEEAAGAKEPVQHAPSTSTGSSASTSTTTPPRAAPGSGESAVTAAAAAKKKEETTRQKNTRKQKLGQANFTVKSNRECPDIFRPS